MTDKKITHEKCVHHRVNAIFLDPQGDRVSIDEWCEYNNDLNKPANECRQFKHLRTILEQAKLTDKKWK